MKKIILQFDQKIQLQCWQESTFSGFDRKHVFQFCRETSFWGLVENTFSEFGGRMYFKVLVEKNIFGVTAEKKNIFRVSTEYFNFLVFRREHAFFQSWRENAVCFLAWKCVVPISTENTLLWENVFSGYDGRIRILDFGKKTCTYFGFRRKTHIFLVLARKHVFGFGMKTCFCVLAWKHILEF